MGLASLNSALSGLKATQQQIALISNNVSNVSTPGYTRKILPQSAQTIQGVTVGVLPGTFTRNVDLNLQRDLWTQISSIEEIDIKQTYLTRIEQFHGDPAAEISIAAEIAALRDAFSALADAPEDSSLLLQTINQATDVANKFNDFATLLNQLRNDVQDEMETSVGRINQILEQIADLNKQIQGNLNIDRPTAALEDQRDEAIKELSGLMKISTFRRGDGVLVVQTTQGVQLADQTAEQLTFRPLPVTPFTTYPSTVAGIYVGDPVTNPTTAVDITASSVGGKLGGLIELRDSEFPKQISQLDELAHKLALRFEAQGLRLFTDPSGNVPADTAPDLGPPVVPVAYIGFAGEMQVNDAVLANHSLLQQGTYGGTIQSSSNEVIRRVLNFSFSNINYQQAFNNDGVTAVDLVNRDPDGIGPLTAPDLQTWLGLFSENQVRGVRDLSAFIDINALVASANGDLDDPADEFVLTFEEARAVPPLGPVSITVDLSAAQLEPGGDALTQLINHINTQIGLLPLADQTALTTMGTSFSAGANGELLIETRASYSIDASGVNGMTQDGLDFLGLTEQTNVAPTDPYFDIKVGNADAVRITIEPGDTEVELLDKINNHQQLQGKVVARVDPVTGVLHIRPGDDSTDASTDFTDQNFGGDIKIISGPFTTSGAAYGTPPATGSTRAAIDDGVNVTSALFGTYTIAGTIINNASPISDVEYVSETTLGSGTYVSFRSNNLGPNADISVDVRGSISLIDYGQKIINELSQDLIAMEKQVGDEDALKTLLETRFLDESGVNIDEELASLIVYQTAYAASARVVNAINDLFDDLLNAI